jgi:biopolymer transport protein ExbB/TolQ
MFYPYIVEAGLIWMLPIVFLSFFATAFVMERIFYWLKTLCYAWNRSKILKLFFQVPFSKQAGLLLCYRSHDAVCQALYEFLQSYENMKLDIAERRAILFAEEKVEMSRQFLDWLSLIANISGTLGLMGTVVGISLSFKTMASEDSKGMALSLATALYTTVGGIILFLIAYLGLFLFQKLSNQLDNALTVNIQRLKNVLEQEEKSQSVVVNKQEIQPKNDYILPLMPNKVQIVMPNNIDLYNQPKIEENNAVKNKVVQENDDIVQSETNPQSAIVQELKGIREVLKQVSK